MELNELSEEQREKARECTTTKELIALAKQEGVDLTDEQLMAFSGGSVSEWFSCSENIQPNSTFI